MGSAVFIINDEAIIGNRGCKLYQFYVAFEDFFVNLRLQWRKTGVFRASFPVYLPSARIGENI